MNLINIGLVTNDGEPISLPWLRSALTLTKVFVARSCVLQSRTKPTFVAELSAPLADVQLDKLCELLKQDCIAYFDGVVGKLAGPKPWGAFDAAQFLLPSGGILIDALTTAHWPNAFDGDKAEAAIATFREAHAEIAKIWGERGHYIGLDRPAWDQPLESGDQL